jgi:hypothetical protein
VPSGVEPAPLRSVHTTTFPPLMRALEASVLVSTYQAGKLVLLRRDGDVLNTHFRGFDKPMGLAVQDDRLALGTAQEIWEFQDLPSAAGKLDLSGKCDACFLPRRSHTTGDIQIHEMAWGAPVADAPGSPSPVANAPGSPDALGSPELWFINTRFSCLCTRDLRYSFVPRWRPPFVSALAPEDRCHLNGLAVVEGQPRYVTALAATDSPAGWRTHKRNGGVLLDVASGEVICRGLSMPHSPRWYADRLWVLDSGAGGLGVVDPASSRYEEVARLPGFTRGLDFCGRYAFVGLSQVRESAIFSGIAVAELPLDQRCCGVWVVDLVSGQTIAFVKFEDAVQEVFAVAVLPGRRFPDLVNDDSSLIADSIALPDEGVPALADSVWDGNLGDLAWRSSHD